MRATGPPPMALRAWPSRCNSPWDSPRPGRAVLAFIHARSARGGRRHHAKTGDIGRPPRSHACFGHET
eukprot:2347144-Pleurochrysis_carterae.AAC.1